MNLREAEAASIREFVKAAAFRGLLSGLVLDYGCGKQPYRDIVENHGGTYHGYDDASFPANVSGEDIYVEDGQLPYADYDAVLCTQVVQYVPDVHDFLRVLRSFIFKQKGHLVLTYPTNWPEVESEDLHRFTKAGMERLIAGAGLTILSHHWRHGFSIQTGESFAAGYGCIARA